MSTLYYSTKYSAKSRSRSLFIFLGKSARVCSSREWIVLKGKCRKNCLKFVQRKCKLNDLCKTCRIDRRDAIYAKLFFKMDKSTVGNDLRLWTLGTNWRYGGTGSYNYKRIQYCWRVLRALYRTNIEWAPVFRVTETGSSGGYLHIHFLQHGFLHHGDLLREWSRITEIKNPNVRFSSKKGDSKKAINYLVKYMTKGSFNKNKSFQSMNFVKYSWLGEWYKIKFDEFDPEQCHHGNGWIKNKFVIDYTGLLSKEFFDNMQQSSNKIESLTEKERFFEYKEKQLYLLKSFE